MKYFKLPKWQLVVLPVVSIVLGIFYFGKYFVAAELINATHRIASLQQDIQGLKNLLDEERARATVAEREVDVVRQANALLRASERERQDQIAALQADLEFYRRLGGASGSQAPLNVHYVELQPTNSPRVYRITLSLTQNLRWAAVISGKVQLEVDGIRNGVAEHLTNAQLLSKSDDTLSFQFKYFQQLEQLITLPEGYEASKLTIKLKSTSLKTPVEQSMDWETLFNRTITDPARYDEPQP